MSARLCPKCRAPLKHETVRGVVIDRCAACKGAWYDWKEIESILESKRSLIHYVPPESQFLYKGKALCPVCGDSMSVLRANSIFTFDIDLCDKEHGIWLDALEFEKVRAVVEKSRYQFKKPKEAPSAVIQLHQKDVAQVETRIESHLQREKYYQTWVTWTLIAANAFVFAWFFFQNKLASAIVNLGLVPDHFLNDPAGSGWMLFSALFLHANLLNLFGNLLFLYLLGKNLEIRTGSQSFLLLYLAGGLMAFIPDLFNHAEAYRPHLGSNAAISALLGAYLIFFAKNQCLIRIGNVFSGTTISIPPQAYIPAWIAFQGICFVTGVPGITLLSHLAGLLIGILFGLACMLLSKKNPSRR